MTGWNRHSKRRAWRQWLTMACVAVAVAWGVLGASSARARLQPYYVLTGESFGQIRPKIMIMLDSSNSMMWVGAGGNCAWDQCEVAGAPQESRISVARRVLREFITENQDTAEFALLTFVYRQAPPTLPAMCTHVDGNPRRFVWTEKFTHGGPINKYPGIAGQWTLCADRDASEPGWAQTIRYRYPYLRSDNLGVGGGWVVPPGVLPPSTPLPPSPIISTDPTLIKGGYNAFRKVQWFPKFMGVRANLNDTTDPGEVLLAQTVGDWGVTLADKQANVKGRDFYYWPYVDGFPGYSHWELLPDATMGFTQTHMNAGVMTSPTTGAGRLAGLSAPFYIGDDAMTAPPPAAAMGPSSAAANLTLLQQLTDTLERGGLDPHSRHGTPLAEAIDAIPATTTYDNRRDQETSVAAYAKFLVDSGASDACRPLALIVMTDAELTLAGTELGAIRLSELRRQLNVRAYVVGMFLPSDPDDIFRLHSLACGAAGACPAGASACADPCAGTPIKNWDTCADEGADPANGCGYVVGDGTGMAEALRGIIAKEFAPGVRKLAGGAAADLVDVGAGADPDAVVRTSLASHTEFPGWKGHVVRTACTDPDPENPAQLAPWCINAGQFSAEEIAAPRFGPCPLSRTWDAGECLRIRDWRYRSVFSNFSSNAVYWVHSGGTLAATAAFRDELVAMGLIAAGPTADAEATAIGEFIKGKHWPDGWKLPGLANAAPVLVRRIPPHRPNVNPALAIRDPHCSGRGLPSSGLDFPASLKTFAEDAWDPAKYNTNPSPHPAYQDVVLIGDDMGVIHAFHYNTGNEIWAYVPRFMLPNVVAQWREDVENRGQPSNLDKHHYGVAATANQGWVYDAAASKWRHLVVFGFGKGAKEYVALDVSHASVFTPGGGVEVLWTSEDPALKATYDAVNGETWARPALTYKVPGNTSDALPEPFLVLAGGYPVESAVQGRTLMLANALTGQVTQSVNLGTPPAFVRWDENTFGVATDPVVTSHCSSRLWAEMQEVYVADPAGRLYRWDQGWHGTPRDHEADGIAVWNPGAFVSVYMNSCQGPEGSCTIGTKREPVMFSPAVSALDRIDNVDGTLPSGQPPETVDQALIALATGSPYDDSIDPKDPNNDFHASLWLLRDDHRSNPNGGFSVPGSQPPMGVSDIGTYPGYMRIPVTNLTRTREYTPYPGAPTYSETAVFRRATRPIRSPRIQVTAVADRSRGGSAINEDLEVFTITYTLYEPPKRECDTRWYDAANKQWHLDEGAVYLVTFRLTASDTGGINFATGAGTGAGFGFAPGLTLVSVEQVRSDECADGVCGPVPVAPHDTPCEAGEFDPGDTMSMAVPLSTTYRDGFSPRE